SHHDIISVVVRAVLRTGTLCAERDHRRERCNSQNQELPPREYMELWPMEWLPWVHKTLAKFRSQIAQRQRKRHKSTARHDAGARRAIYLRRRQRLFSHDRTQLHRSDKPAMLRQRSPLQVRARLRELPWLSTRVQ